MLLTGGFAVRLASTCTIVAALAVSSVWVAGRRPVVAQVAPAGATTIPVFVGTGRSADGFRPADRELARWALDRWQQVLAPLRLVDAPEPEALIRVYWAGALGGEYGEMRPLEVGGRRGAALYIRPDTSALGPDIARRSADDPLLRDTIVYLTCLHETGHALGLGHTSDFRDIMYFFGYGGDIVEYFERYRRHLHIRADIPSVSGLSESDVQRVRAAQLAR